MKGIDKRKEYKRKIRKGREKRKIKRKWEGKKGKKEVREA